MQSIDLRQTYAYASTKYLTSQKEKIKFNLYTSIHKLITKNFKKHNPTWLKIPDYPYKILRIWNIDNWRIWKNNYLISLFNFLSHQPDIYKIYFNAKEPYETKYCFLKLTNKKFRIQAFK